MIYFPVKGLKSPWGNRVKNAHLSKGPSDLKQNRAQDITPFYCQVFHALALSVASFVLNVANGEVTIGAKLTTPLATTLTYFARK